MYRPFDIENAENPKRPFLVVVQADKNYGICDVINASSVVVRTVDAKTKKEVLVKSTLNRRIPEVLSQFQGRQITDWNVLEELTQALTSTLNNHGKAKL